MLAKRVRTYVRTYITLNESALVDMRTRSHNSHSVHAGIMGVLSVVCGSTHARRVRAHANMAHIGHKCMGRCYAYYYMRIMPVEHTVRLANTCQQLKLIRSRGALAHLRTHMMLMMMMAALAVVVVEALVAHG